MTHCDTCNGIIKEMPVYEENGFLVCSLCGDSSMRRNKPIERLLFGNYDYFRCLLCDIEISSFDKTVDHLKHVHPSEVVSRLIDQPNCKFTKTNCQADVIIIATERNLYRIDVSIAKYGVYLSVTPFRKDDEGFVMRYDMRGGLMMTGFLPSGAKMHLEHTGVPEIHLGIACFLSSQ